MKKIIYLSLSLLTFFLIISSWLKTQFAYSFPSTPLHTQQRFVPTPSPTKIGYPVNLQIPKIGVNAKIEWVGLDRDNNMDVPKSWENVGWYSPGYLPGSVGNAVIDGHLDSPFGPAVFWRLSELNQGDMVQVTDSNNNIYKFRVEKVENYPYNSFPIEKVFGKTDRKRLNLITCSGVFDQSINKYLERTVIYSSLED